MFWYLLFWNLGGNLFWGAADYFANRKKPDFSLQSLIVSYVSSFILFAVLGYFIRERAVLGLMFFFGPSFGSRLFKLISNRKQ